MSFWQIENQVVKSDGGPPLVGGLREDQAPHISPLWSPSYLEYSSLQQTQMQRFPPKNAIAQKLGGNYDQRLHVEDYRMKNELKL